MDEAAYIDNDDEVFGAFNGIRWGKATLISTPRYG
jgi:hypothetical protein